MSYERDEAMRQQDATEAMIRMREPRGLQSNRTFTVNAPGLDRAHAALKSLVTKATGVAIPERRQIVLVHGDTTIAKIEITDDSVWSEFANLGFSA